MNTLKVKICGITRCEDAVLAVEEGADYLGFVLAPSVRQISLESAGVIISRLHDRFGDVLPRMVAVVVQPDSGLLDRIADSGLFDVLQIHKPAEPFPTYCRIPWCLSVPVPAQRDAGIVKYCNEDIDELAFSGTAGLVLCDAAVQGVCGGSGIRVDSSAARFVRDRARRHGFDFILAGGLRPESVSVALTEIEPDGVDVASGLEDRPGIKSAEKIHAFMTAVRRWESGRLNDMI